METFDYIEEYTPSVGFARYASVLLVRSLNRKYWETSYESFNHHFVLDDFGYLVHVGMW